MERTTQPQKTRTGPSSCVLCVFVTVILLSASAAIWPLVKPYLQAPVDLPLPLIELIMWVCVGFFGGAMAVLVGLVFFMRCETMIILMNELLGACCHCTPCAMPPNAVKPPPPSVIEGGGLLTGATERQQGPNR